MKQEKRELAVVRSKGQIAVPQPHRKELATTPKSEVCVYRSEDTLATTKPSSLDDLKKLIH